MYESVLSKILSYILSCNNLHYKHLVCVTPDTDNSQV